jgi:hypothetical protein
LPSGSAHAGYLPSNSRSSSRTTRREATKMTPLEVLSYLTDPVFCTVVALTVGTFIALELINKIGGRP